MNKYRELVAKCFTHMDDKDIDKMFAFADDSFNIFPQCADFKKKFRKYLFRKGVHKDDLDDIMEVFQLAYAVGYTTGGVMTAMCMDDDKKDDNLYEF